MGKSVCPTCHQDLSTPPLINPQEWANLVCTNCKARLRLKNPSRSNFLLLFGLSLTGLGGSHLAPRWLGLLLIIIGIMLGVAAFVFFVGEIRKPVLQTKKPLPQPESVLNLSNH